LTFQNFIQICNRFVQLDIFTNLYLVLNFILILQNFDLSFLLFQHIYLLLLNQIFQIQYFISKYISFRQFILRINNLFLEQLLINFHSLHKIKLHDSTSTATAESGFHNSWESRSFRSFARLAYSAQGSDFGFVVGFILAGLICAPNWKLCSGGLGVRFLINGFLLGMVLVFSFVFILILG
jgi:hypothetical protein